MVRRQVINYTRLMIGKLVHGSLFGGYFACGPQAGRLAVAEKVACGSSGHTNARTRRI